MLGLAGRVALFPLLLFPLLLITEMEPNVFGRSIRSFSRRCERLFAKGSVGQPVRDRYAKNVSLQLSLVSRYFVYYLHLPASLFFLILHTCTYGYICCYYALHQPCFVCLPSLPMAKFKVILVKSDVRTHLPGGNRPLFSSGDVHIHTIGKFTYPSDIGAVSDRLHLDLNSSPPRRRLGGYARVPERQGTATPAGSCG